MGPQKNTCIVFVETLGEKREVPISSIKTIPSVSWMIPNYRNRSDKKRKRYQSDELCKSNGKYSKMNEDAFHDFHYFTKTLHIPQQYCEYITQPQYNTTRYSKTDETGGGNNNQQPNTKNVPTKKPNQGGEKIMKADNGKNVPAKRQTTADTTKASKTELLNVEFEPHVHYGSQANMGYVDTTSGVAYTHMERVDIEGSTIGHNYGE